jgi:hypothetical protein
VSIIFRNEILNPFAWSKIHYIWIGVCVKHRSSLHSGAIFETTEKRKTLHRRVCQREPARRIKIGNQPRQWQWQWQGRFQCRTRTHNEVSNSLGIQDWMAVLSRLAILLWIGSAIPRMVQNGITCFRQWRCFWIRWRGIFIGTDADSENQESRNLQYCLMENPFST